MFYIYIIHIYNYVLLLFFFLYNYMFDFNFQHGGKKRELAENTEESGTPSRKRTRVDVGGL